jgi:hypothetical protein
MKGILILFGESFRLGGQHNRNIGSDESYNEQMNASKSHIKFIENLKEKHCSIDVCLTSYHTQFDEKLKSLYSNYLIKSIFYNKLIGPHNLIHNTLNDIIDIQQYHFVLIMRIDIYLKTKFIEIFNTNWDKILFPCCGFIHKNNMHPRVNDMMVYIPKKYYKYTKNIVYGHSMWYYFMKTTDLTYDDLDTMIHTFHDSNSAKDYNPLYYIVNRPKSYVFHSEGEIFNKYNLFNNFCK